MVYGLILNIDKLISINTLINGNDKCVLHVLHQIMLFLFLKNFKLCFVYIDGIITNYIRAGNLICRTYIIIFEKKFKLGLEFKFC